MLWSTRSGIFSVSLPHVRINLSAGDAHKIASGVKKEYTLNERCDPHTNIAMLIKYHPAVSGPAHDKTCLEKVTSNREVKKKERLSGKEHSGQRAPPWQRPNGSLGVVGHL